MILALDIGNTHTVIGAFDSTGLIEISWRIRTEKNQTADEFRLGIEQLLERRGYSLRDVQGIIIGSVVPSLTDEVRKAFKNNLKVVDYSMNFNFTIRVPYPYQIGADRLINAQAAVQEFKPPLLIIDAGTATTFCYIDDDSNYRGGSILPGLKISAEALFQRASRLVAVDLEAPDSVLGSTTETALQSGIVFGYCSMIDGLIDRYQEQFGQNLTIVTTGGLLQSLKKHLKHEIHFDENLTLKGLWSLWKQN